MKKFRYIYTWFFLIVLVFTITPKEFFHAFHDHHNEIEHIDLDCHSIHFEKKHKHCSALNIITPSFCVDAYKDVLPYFEHIGCYTFSYQTVLRTPVHFLFNLKAPPSELNIS